MERINFTQAAMYQLATINTHLRRTVGRSYRVSSLAELELLLKEAFASEDPSLKERCKRLHDCLWADEQKKLFRLLQVDASLAVKD